MMRKNSWLLLLLPLLASCGDGGRGESGLILPEFRDIRVKYPETFRDTTVVDDYFGKKVGDPYRWLEDGGSEAAARWLQQQRSLTENYFSNIPYREAIRNRLAALWNYERYSAPMKRGNYYYIFKNDGLQNHDVLFRMASLDGPMEPVLNPNNFSPDGTASLGEYGFSKDASLLAYQVSEGGSDWRTIFVRDLSTGGMLKDTVRWVKFSPVSWYRDGFFYSRYPEPRAGEGPSARNEFHQVYYHRVGTPQSEDELAYTDRRNPQRYASAEVTEDERFLILYTSESTGGNALYFRGLSTGDPFFTPVVETFDYDFTVVGNDQNALYVLTNHKAPNGRLIRISTLQPDVRYWEEVIPESADVLQEAYLFGGKIVAHYLHDASSQARVFSLDGAPGQSLKLPGMGAILNFSGRPDSSEVFYEFTALTQPPTVYRLGLNTMAQSVYKQPETGFDSRAYVVQQVKYKSYDGTMVPMFIVHRKGLKLDGARPTLLYGNGGFGIPVLPVFNPTGYMLFPVVLENDGVCALANIRGGGEFGKAWHEAGAKGRKQNTFDDFQAAAEYLIANNYTSPKKLAIHGASNGGLLVGACLAQRPDLYAVALPSAGVFDMLRYQKFTIGWAWADDYGASDNRAGFDYLMSYSPLHNIGREAYPATLITTAGHDGIVVPAHSFKFAAALQAHQQGNAPLLIRIEPGAGASTGKRIAQGADMLAFLFYNMKEGFWHPGGGE